MERRDLMRIVGGFGTVAFVSPSVRSASAAQPHGRIDAVIFGAWNHQFQPMWNDQRSGVPLDLQTWRARRLPNGFFRVGDIAETGRFGRVYGSLPRGTLLVVRGSGNGGPVKHPLDYELIWDDSGTRANIDGSFWKPIPPIGYVALGMVAMLGRRRKPERRDYMCVHESLVVRARVGPEIWNDHGSGGDEDVSLWSYRVDPEFPEGVPSGSFIAVKGYDPGKAPAVFNLNPTCIHSTKFIDC